MCVTRGEDSTLNRHLMLSFMIFSELILDLLWFVFQYVEQLLQNGQYLEFYIGKSVERLFILIAKVSSLGKLFFVPKFDYSQQAGGSPLSNEWELFHNLIRK